MILPILISFLVGIGSGFTAQILADRMKPADQPTPIIICVTQNGDQKPNCEKAEIKK